MVKLPDRSAPTQHVPGQWKKQVTNLVDPRAEAPEQQKAAKRIKQEPKPCKPSAPAANKAPARAAAHRLPAAAHQQPVKVEKQPMPVAEPAEDAGEVAEEDEENLHPVPQKVSPLHASLYLPAAKILGTKIVRTAQHRTLEQHLIAGSGPC